MSARIVVATVARVLRQLRSDHRTVAMVLLVPLGLLTILRFMYEDSTALFDRVGVAMLGIFPFVVMFLVTSIAMLRERTSGTLERLLTTPLAKLDLLLGYGAAFALVAATQAVVATVFAFRLLGLGTAGSPALVVVVAVVNAVLGVALGLLCSAFARTEFQAVQFMPVAVVPQFLLCGLIVPRDEMAGWLEAISAVLPMTYAVRALQTIGSTADATAEVWRDVAVVGGFVMACLVGAAATLRRRTG